MKLTEIMALELPEPKYVVDGVITEGVNLIAGPPKISKSWLVHAVGLAVANGGLRLVLSQSNSVTFCIWR